MRPAATVAPAARGRTLRAAFLLLLLAIALPAAQAQNRIQRINPGSVLSARTNTTSQSNTQLPNTETDTATVDSTANNSLEYHTELPDSVLRRKVFMFRYRPTRVWIDELWCPTLDPTGVQYHDPLDAMNGNYYLGKGTLGHQHVSLYPTLADGLGLKLQAYGYDGYYMTPATISLYQTLTPFTLLSYNSSLNKDYGLRIAHTQNIKPGWNVALNYRLFSPEGVYTSSGAVNNYLNATTNYFSPDARLQAVAGIIWHKFSIQENGGLSDDNIFTQNRQSNRAGIPVVLNGMTQQKDLAAFGRATYSLTRQSDHYRHRDSLSVRVVNDSVTVLDTIEVIDTIPLKAPRLLNLGVVGLEVNHDRRKRRFSDSTLWRESEVTLFWTNDAYPEHRWRNPLKVTIGATPRMITAVLYGDTLRCVSSLDPFGRAEIALFRGTLTLEGDMRSSFGLQPNPDTRLSARLDYPFDSARLTFITLDAVVQRQTPDLRMVYDATMRQGLTLGALAVERYQMRFVLRDMLDIDLRTNHLNHNTWYAQNGSVVEGSQPLWLTQATALLHLKLGPMRLDMQQMLQHSTDGEQMPVPLWASKNSLYSDFTLFKRQLRVQLGLDVRYHTPYLAPEYDPATGLFRHQSDVTVGGYLWGDLFLNLQVKRASIYVKAGHLNALWDEHPQYFLLPHYPGQKFGLFWGLTWCFFD